MYELTKDDYEVLRYCDRMVTDAEWKNQSVYDEFEVRVGATTNYLTIQMTFTAGYQQMLTVVLWHEDYPLPSPAAIKRLTGIIEHKLVVIKCDVQNTTVLDLGYNFKRLTIGSFWAAKDIEAVVGRQPWLNALIGGDGKPATVKKLRNMQGVVKTGNTTFVLDDHYGMYGGATLDKAADMVGVVNPWKSHLTGDEKGYMDVHMRADPDKFLEYAVGDTVCLDPMLTARCKQLNNIIHRALGVKDMFDENTLPRSTGSLVAKTFENNLMRNHQLLYRATLQLTDTGNDKLWTALSKHKEEALGGDVHKINKTLRKSDYIHGLAMGSIRNFALLHPGTTGVYPSVVQGGRCVCEEPQDNPFKRVVFDVLDPDLKSCYGEGLRTKVYPIGIPTVFAQGRDDKPVTLREFIKKNNHELIPGLAVIYVSGRLSFDQDLIPSKYELNIENLMNTLTAGKWHEGADFGEWGREIEHAHMGGEFHHTLKQIELGVITLDVLQTLKAVLSNQEWAEFLNLRVTCAAYYPRSLEMEQMDWASQAFEGELGEKKAEADTRTRTWTSIPMEEFIGGFINARDELKKLQHNETDPAKKRVYELQQKSVKLFINTTYGCLAAPYFPMGNTILANNITAQARVNAWMMSKAFLSAQSITDGGLTGWKEVAFLAPGSKKPSMDTLSNRVRLVKHRGLRIGPLTTEDVYKRMGEGRTGEDEAWVNKLMLDHANTFWSNYTYPDENGLPVPLKLTTTIEVKYDHTCKAAVYSNSDYLLFDTVNTDKDHPTKLYYDREVSFVVKSRGAKEHDHPKKDWLFHLLSEVYAVPEAYFEYKELIGIPAFQKTPNKFLGMGLMPGDELRRETHHQPWNNDALVDDWEAVVKRQTSNRQAGVRYKRALKENPEERFGFAKQAEVGKLKRDAKNARRAAQMVAK